MMEPVGIRGGGPLNSCAVGGTYGSVTLMYRALKLMIDIDLPLMLAYYVPILTSDKLVFNCN